MFCHKCGNGNPDDAQFCNKCGAGLPVETSVETPVESEEPPQEEVAAPDVETAAPESVEVPASYPTLADVATPAEPPKKKRGCKGCILWGLAVFVVLIVIVAVAVGWYFKLPQEWGWIDGADDVLFEPSPNPWAAEALENEFAEAGQPFIGLRFIVISEDGGATHIAYALADESEGFVWSGSPFENPLEGLLIHTAATDAAIEYSIERVAVDYRDSAGEQVAVMTAPSEALVSFALGEISQQELFDQMNGRSGNPTGISIGGE